MTPAIHLGCEKWFDDFPEEIDAITRTEIFTIDENRRETIANYIILVPTTRVIVFSIRRVRRGNENNMWGPACFNAKHFHRRLFRI